jgi:GR25 family glycosyltransferase involved in LPS biosynthesis
MRDAMGYAIRADTAQDLLNHAQGDVSVAGAIKHVVGGGMCVPMIETDQMKLDQEMKNEEEEGKEMAHDSAKEQKSERDEIERTEKELQHLRAQQKNTPTEQMRRGPDTAPDVDEEREAARADNPASAAHQEIKRGTTNAGPSTGDPTSDMHVFVLTLPSRMDKFEHFLHGTASQGYVGTQEIRQISGTDFERYYPTDQEIKDMQFSSDVLLAKKQNAVHQMIQSFAAQSADEGEGLPENFEEAAIKNLTPKQVGTYIGHMKFWLHASKLPPNSWAVMLEDDVDVIGGPTVMRNWIQQAEQTGAKLNGEAAHFIYLRQCASGKKFQQSFLRDSAGYAIRPATAKALLSQARGDEPVNLALKAYTQGGLCVPLIAEKQIVKKGGELAQHHLTDPPMNMFVLTVPRHRNRIATFRKEADALGFTKGDAIQEVSGIDFNNFYPLKDQVKYLKWSEKDQELEKQKALAFILKQYKQDPESKKDPNADSLSEAFANDAMNHLSPEQLATYLGHRRMWQKAAELPKDSWAVILEDDATPVTSPDALRSMIKSADVGSMQQLHRPAQLVYLKPCPPGKTFMQYFMRDAMGYAIRPHVAKALLQEGSGALSVASAVKTLTNGGGCVPFIK